ncbi:MAG TPA: transposase [Stellaceae bacterium]|nr:transposase [Stellaceae bacterium]
MSTIRGDLPALPTGEQPVVEQGSAGPVVADTFAGRIHVEWDNSATVTPLGQLPFFVEFLKQGGLFDGFVADCPLHYTSPNAPDKRDVLGTVLLSVLAGHRRYAHMTALRCDPVNPPLLGMAQVVSEDAVRRALDKIEEPAGLAWLQQHLDYTTRPLLSEPWILDVDTTVKPLYGHQEGAVVSYNPHKPGRPSHSYHSYLLANLRLVLAVEVAPGNQHTSKHSAPGLWKLVDGLAPELRPWLIRGDVGFGNEPVMREAEQRRQPYLFKLRLTKGVKRAIERAMGEQEWRDAGAGWQGKDGELRLQGWSRQRRIVIPRRRVERSAALTDGAADGQLRLGFAEIDGGREVWEYAVLVTSLTAEILTIGQLYRDRADGENNFDELKNQWGWGGFTTRDLKRCRLMAGCVALVFNWWNLFVRLADPDHHREAITSRPLLLQAIGRQTTHAGRTTVTITSSHGAHDRARTALTRIAGFFAQLRSTAEQLTALERWYRILSQALKKYLRGRQLVPPRQFQPAGAASYG